MSPEKPSPGPERGRPKRHRPSRPLTDEDRKEIERLSQKVHLGQRKIADQLGLGRKQVRLFLESLPDYQPRTPEEGGKKAALLEDYMAQIEAKVAGGLTTTRILREIQEEGYRGGRTILGELVRELRSKLLVPPRRKQAKVRFETEPAEEMQMDFGTYRVPIGGVETTVHAFVAGLAWSRLASVDCFRNQKQSTVLEAIDGAVRDFDGSAKKCVIDNITAIVLGRVHQDGKRKPLLHPIAVDFSKHYGFVFAPCAPYHPDRKGEVESLVGYFERDFIRGSSFESWEELRRRAREWCRNVANKRRHGTTGLVPEQAWRERERELLVRLPPVPFAVHRDEPRAVGPDATLSIAGTLYTVPAELASTVVTVRLYAHHFEVLDRKGAVAMARSYVDPRDRGKLQLEPAHYESIRRKPRDRGRRLRLDETLRSRFPGLGPLLDGIARRMKTLAHVHLGLLLRLLGRFGPDAFLDAATRAQDAKRHDARAVERILEKEHPFVDEVPPVATLGGAGAVLLAEVEEDSLDRFAALDGDDPKEEDHGT